MKKNKLEIIFTPLLVGLFLSITIVSKSNIISVIPSWIFPVAWTILYLLMGVSSYMIYREDKEIPKIYFIQLVFNYLWIIIFFFLNKYILSFIWIIILIILVIKMIKEFYQINKVSGYLQIPYLVWLTVAAYLNLIIIL